MTKRTLRVVRTGPPAAPPLPQTKPSPRRMLHRVETALLDVQASLCVDTEVYHGHLINLSAGGCAVRLTLPLTLTLDAGATIKAALMADHDTILCDGELVGLTMGRGAAMLRLRFHALPLETRRSLLAWIGHLARREMQRRHTQRERLIHTRRMRKSVGSSGEESR